MLFRVSRLNEARLSQPFVHAGRIDGTTGNKAPGWLGLLLKRVLVGSIATDGILQELELSMGRLCPRAGARCNFQGMLSRFAWRHQNDAKIHNLSVAVWAARLGAATGKRTGHPKARV